MSMDEKQWLVSRLDTASNAIFDQFQLAKEDLMRIREDLTFSITSKRNYVLSSVIFVSVLLATLHEIKLIDTKCFLSLLTLDLLVGLIIFIIASKYVKSTKFAFINIENSIVHAQEEISYNFGFFIENTMEITNVEMTTLREYGEFMRALYGITYIPYAKALIESSKSKLLDHYYKKSFVKSAKEFEKFIELAITIFNNMNKQNLPKQSVEYTTNMILMYEREHPLLK